MRVSRRFDELGSVADSGQARRIALNAYELSGTTGTIHIPVVYSPFYFETPGIIHSAKRE